MPSFNSKFSGGGGSLVVTDLQVDGTTLVVDETNNRLGIGVADPDSTLEVLSTTTQQKWSYDADSFATLTVADASNTTIATGESGDLILDAADDIILDSHLGKWRFKRNGTMTCMVSTTSGDGSNMIFDHQISDADYVFKCSDGGVGITALTIDASDAGAATFNGSVSAASLSATTTAVIGTDTTLGTAGNTTAVSIATVTNTGTTAGKDLKISAGSTTTNGSNIDGGDLILESGGGDGTGTSSMQFRTKVNGTDTSAERMRIHTDGNVGIGVADPDALLEVAGDVHLTGTTPTLTIGDAGQEDTMLVFDGNAVDFRVGLDDGTDTLEIGVGSTHGTTPAILVGPDAGIDVMGALGINASIADEAASGITAVFTAGETLVRGEVCYFKAGDSKMWKAVATAAATSRCVAMAAEDISADAAGKFLLHGFLRDAASFPSYTIGGALFTPEAEQNSENVPEQAAPDSDGDFVQVIGWAVTADLVFFNPSGDIVEVA